MLSFKRFYVMFTSN